MGRGGEGCLIDMRREGGGECAKRMTGNKCGTGTADAN